MIVKGQKTESMVHSEIFIFLTELQVLGIVLKKKKYLYLSDKCSAHATNIKHTFNQ